MASNEPARLTKKQKKATAFRDRSRKGKGKGNPAPPGRSRRPSAGDIGEGEDDEDALNAVPALEDQILSEVAGGAEDDEGRAGVPKVAVEATTTKKKRRMDEDGDAQSASAKKKAKVARGGSDEVPPAVARDDEDEAGRVVGNEENGDGAHGSEDSKQRYILFIGNLKYTTTREAIQNHFSACEPPPTVRLLTPKVARAGATVAKSKGCAFLEFSTRPALQAALRLHQSELDGRRINVELTAGGGGKGDARLAKVKARNKQLTAQRTRRSLKAATAQGEGSGPQASSQPQRFSTTSGEGDVPRTKRTWTVSDEDHGGKHRGGRR
ncbi:hypothetical protein BJV78DRAFT_2447 [Lactifluus subvellereus]|nr:hypothetical protein BJV78DRAFT_2447 [Lactifluus subvellereus]